MTPRCGFAATEATARPEQVPQRAAPVRRVEPARFELDAAGSFRHGQAPPVPTTALPGDEAVDLQPTADEHLADEIGREETVLVVAHSGVLRILAGQILAMDAGQLWQMRLDKASLSIIETRPEGAVMALLNDISYLANEE